MAKPSLTTATKNGASKKVKVPKAAAKVVKEASAEGGKRADLYAKKIKVLVKENPKRPGTKAYDRFELYKKHHTVGDFFAAGGTTRSIRHDKRLSYIALS